MFLSLTIVVLYQICMIGVGYYFYTKRTGGITDYFLAGKQAPWYLIAGSLFGTGIGAGAAVGLAESTYRQQTIAAAWKYGGTYAIAGILLLLVLLSDKLPQSTGVTIPEIMEDRYDRKTRNLMTVFFILAFIGALGAQWLAVGSIISFFFPDTLSIFQATVLGATVVTLYTLLGGMSAVMWTDLIQAIILFVGFWLLAVVAIPEFGGWTTIARDASTISSQALDPLAIRPISVLGFTLQFLPLFLIGQDLLQRIMAARSNRDARIGIILAGIFASVLVVIPVFAGIIGFVRYPDIGNPKYIIPQLVVDVLPVWAGGILLAALVAAVMSTGDSLLLTTSSNVVNDFYLVYVDTEASPALQQRISRLVILFTSLVSVAMAFALPRILNLLIVSTLVIAAGGVIPWLAVFYWPRATANAAFWSMLIAGFSAAIWGVLGFLNGSTAFMGVPPMVIGLPLSLLLFIGLSIYEEPEYDRALATAEQHNLSQVSDIRDMIADE